MPFFSVNLENRRFIINAVVLDTKKFTIEEISAMAENGEFQGDGRTTAKALIDTGATDCSITQEIADQLNLDSKGRNIMLTAGYPIECNEYLVTLGIPVREITSHEEDEKHFKTLTQNVVALPKLEGNLTRGFDVILGMDFLGRMMFHYTGDPAGSGGRFTLGY